MIAFWWMPILEKSAKATVNELICTLKDPPVGSITSIVQQIIFTVKYLKCTFLLSDHGHATLMHITDAWVMHNSCTSLMHYWRFPDLYPGVRAIFAYSSKLEEGEGLWIFCMINLLWRSLSGEIADKLFTMCMIPLCLVYDWNCDTFSRKTKCTRRFTFWHDCFSNLHVWQGRPAWIVWNWIKMGMISLKDPPFRHKN